MPKPLADLKRGSGGSFNLVRLRSQQVDNLALISALEDNELKHSESTFKPLVKLRSQRIDLS